MFHNIKTVKPLENFILEITFQDDTIKYYDVKPLFNKCTIFQNLITVNGLFQQVKVDKGGYGKCCISSYM